MGGQKSAASELEAIAREVIECAKCPRLAEWREEAGRNPPKRFAGEPYHAKAVPGFGDAKARVLVVGLAPAAHGANRTGRMFTGDRSGDWLYRALHKAGMANQGESGSIADGLKLRGAYVTAVCRCAPPGNKPTREEIENCKTFLDRELEIFWPRLRVIVALGSIGMNGVWAALKRRGVDLPSPRAKFSHGGRVELGDQAPTILMSYHPSQQNTFTGRLTEPMFDSIWTTAREIAGR